MTDTSQFEAFMSAYQNMVYSTAMRLLGNEADAEDVAQEVFVRAYDHFDSLQTPSAGGWLKTVTRNLCLNHLSRYRARWRFFSELSGPDEEGSFEQDLPAPDLHEAATRATDDRQVLEAALRKLPDAQRVPLVLYHFEDLSYEDIATRLKISLSKVKTDIHRARAVLRRALSRHTGELGAGTPARSPSTTPAARVPFPSVTRNASNHGTVS
jgi:RNA polymerase sigma-70 factor (ECF subfamily)